MQIPGLNLLNGASAPIIIEHNISPRGTEIVSPTTWDANGQGDLDTFERTPFTSVGPTKHLGGLFGSGEETTKDKVKKSNSSDDDDDEERPIDSAKDPLDMALANNLVRRSPGAHLSNDHSSNQSEKYEPFYHSD
jgi:hypothetical protein